MNAILLRFMLMLWGKPLKRDIEKMLVELGEDASRFGHIYLDSMNREQTEYRLDRELTETLLFGYSAPLRLNVIRRLRGLDEFTANPTQIWGRYLELNQTWFHLRRRLRTYDGYRHFLTLSGGHSH